MSDTHAPNNLQDTLEAHRKWLGAEPGGSRADLHGADLHGADLHGADLHGADLRGADLRDANLHGADLHDADLSGADLRDANLRGADLRDADLSGANLRDANLRGADLRDADLSGANLRGADLSGAKNLLSVIMFMSGFEKDDVGVIVYKRIGNGTSYTVPAHWKIEPGAFLTEVVNPDRCTVCGCGVNFGTRQWCDNNYQQASLWRCRIRWSDLCGVVVPYNTDGKARCERLELIEKVA